MPELTGRYPRDERVFTWKGKFLSGYEVINSNSYNLGRVVWKRLDDISWVVARTLIERDSYLFGLSNAFISPMADADYSEINIQCLVGDLKENKLSIDELNYWEEKYHERLMFDLSAYAGRMSWARPQEKTEEQTLQKLPVNISPPRKWKIIEKGKLNG